MLTSIPRFSKVMEANVGPRFAAYSTYTRPGVSLQIVAVTPLFEQPQRAYTARAFVPVKVYAPFGAATASALLIAAPVPTYKPRAIRGYQTIASATILGERLTQEFGYCL